MNTELNPKGGNKRDAADGSKTPIGDIMTDRQRRDWEDWHANTSGGKLFQQIEQIAKDSEFKPRVEGINTSQEVFHLGSEMAVWIAHFEADGSIGNYVRLVDLQKDWWRKALENIGYTLDNLHLIPPTIFEALNGVDAEGAEKFRVKKLCQTLGVQEDKSRQVLQALADEVAPRVTPDFSVENCDRGSFVTAQRLIPKNAAAQRSCIERTDPYVTCMKRILDDYPKIEAKLREKIAV